MSQGQKETLRNAQKSKKSQKTYLTKLVIAAECESAVGRYLCGLHALLGKLCAVDRLKMRQIAASMGFTKQLELLQCHADSILTGSLWWNCS